MAKYVLFYTSGRDVAANAGRHFAAHRARYLDFHARGLLLMVGPFENPHQEGAMSVFTSREAAEDFARDDPFVVNGVVSGWRVVEWNEVLATPL
jgi:uncharacterized protein